MVFDNMDELINHVHDEAIGVLNNVKWHIRDILEKFLDKYYDEYDPDFYERTYQLYSSLIMTDIKKVGNLYVAEVYFDASKLDYSMKKFTRWIGYDGQFYNPFNPSSKSSDGWFYNKGHDENKTLTSAMIGSKPHGGKASGTAIWIESLKEIHNEFVPFCLREFEARGIPVRAIH